MKKIVLFLSLFFTSIIVANAELCVYVTGDGTKIGDEIACGTEHFYVISNDGENIRMMAKYNLYVGSNYYRVDFDTTYTDERDIYLNKEVQQKVIEGYNLYDSLYDYDLENDTYIYNGASLYKNIRDEEIDEPIVFFDEPKTMAEALQEEVVQEYLSKGYLYNFYTLSTNKYIGVKFRKYIDNRKYKAVVLNNKYSTQKQLLNDSEIQKYYDYNIYTLLTDSETNKYIGAIIYQDTNTEYRRILLNSLDEETYLLELSDVTKYTNAGYKIYEKKYENNQYIGITFAKEKNTEYKTIKLVQPEDKNYPYGYYLSDKGIYEEPNVQEHLNNGYKIYSKHYVNYSFGGGYKTYKIDGITFVKNKDYEYYTIIFNEEIESDELSSYLNNNEEYQKKLKEGYSNSKYLTVEKINEAGTHLISSYYGITLEKYIGEKNDEEYEEELIENEKIYQNEIAIGAHGTEEGKPAPFENGVIYSENMNGYFSESDKTYGTGFKDYEYYESEYENSAYYYLSTYKNTLIDEGYDILDIDVITVSEINDLVYKASGKRIPLEDWYDEGIGWRDDYATGNEYYVLGSIKDLMPKGYEWLWGTTYWTRTADPDFNNIYFIDTLGDLCSNEYCGVAIGAGIRPIVTIKVDDVVYKIDTVTDGHGMIKADYIEAKEGTVVKFTVEPMEGYVLGEVKVTDANGNVVIFTDYTFTMPDANVTIEATFVKIDNPNTMTYISVIVVIGLMISGAFLYKSKKKIN